MDVPDHEDIENLPQVCETRQIEIMWKILNEQEKDNEEMKKTNEDLDKRVQRANAIIRDIKKIVDKYKE